MAEIGLLAQPAFVPAPGISAVVLPPLRSIANIALLNDQLAELQDVLGVTLPGPGRQLRDHPIRYLWSGPENWLAVAADDDPDFGSKLAQSCAGLAAVTDQSDGRTILQIKGPNVRGSLAKLLPIDLHPSAFPPDATALTLAGHIPIQIWAAEEDGFELACFRSYAETLYEALREAVLL